MVQKIGLVLLTLLLLVVWVSHTPAQSISNLQTDIYDLRMQVSQLQTQVAQLSRQPSSSLRRSPPVTPTRINPKDSQMIDRLAILAIEAKDRLTALEARVSRLEQRHP